MPLHHKKWAAKMHEDCEVESCSFLMYLSNLEFSKECIDQLLLHTNQQNGKRQGWDYLATFWEWYYNSDLNHWILIVASVTSRASIVEYHVREGKVGAATDLLLKDYVNPGKGLNPLFRE
jgi:hypothetical protein